MKNDEYIFFSKSDEELEASIFYNVSYISRNGISKIFKMGPILPVPLHQKMVVGGWRRISNFRYTDKLCIRPDPPFKTTPQRYGQTSE